jgi:hypothetical protein
MNSEQALLQKLMVSKKIMEKHEGMSRNNTSNETSQDITVQDFKPIQGNYNIPQEYLSESEVRQQSFENTEDKIMNSKLPDEIKRLMLEHPINQPTNMGGPTLSNDLVEKASRLMNTKANGDTTSNTNIKRSVSQNSQSVGISSNEIKMIVRETVEDVLRENGLITESESKTNDIFKFRVGQHIFEGRLSKIKKISK